MTSGCYDIGTMYHSHNHYTIRPLNIDVYQLSCVGYQHAFVAFSTVLLGSFGKYMSNDLPMAC
jgi:hypothetical protein